MPFIFICAVRQGRSIMTTINNSKKFFVFGLLNGAGETFSGKKEYVSVIDGGKKGQSFYEGLGFTSVAMTTCHGIALIKDSNDRLLSFVAPVSHMSKKTCTQKEYNMAYWAWCEVKRQAEIVAKKATEKAKPSVEVNTEEDVFVRPEGQNKNFYAVISVEYTGFVLKWARCKELTDGKSAKFKGFNGLEQAKAWMRENHAPDASFEHITDIRQIK